MGFECFALAHAGADLPEARNQSQPHDEQSTSKRVVVRGKDDKNEVSTSQFGKSGNKVPVARRGGQHVEPAMVACSGSS
ncbi:hypothetical protein RFM41_33200 [Mesorhizobium sp. VK25A]|uniref:Uncharacterized protein n=1 Tax=Mesorhizobium vachelliae TaxID=3072309 RepID=A0ABU5AEZ4_9HYPH|nr:MULTISPECIES: hypothetical protein [unclassified Mesorhizobium]MDX8535854.1 hypothetical protein [Mesorhizobium sp. VK25D]MDX8548604.1 hypothetical protein [Mesorhizobium sp. VK25A]